MKTHAVHEFKAFYCQTMLLISNRNRMARKFQNSNVWNFIRAVQILDNVIVLIKYTDVTLNDQVSLGIVNNLWRFNRMRARIIKKKKMFQLQ